MLVFSRSDSQLHGTVGPGVDALQDALAFAEQIRSVGLQHTILHNLGDLHSSLNALEEAEGYYLRALNAAQIAGSLTDCTLTLSGLTSVLWKLGEYHAASDYLHGDLEIAMRTGNLHEAGQLMHLLGVLAIENREYDQAQALLEMPSSLRKRPEQAVVSHRQNAFGLLQDPFRPIRGGVSDFDRFDANCREVGRQLFGGFS